MKKTSLYLDAENFRALKVLAAERDTTVTELINQAVAEYLQREVPGKIKQQDQAQKAGT